MKRETRLFKDLPDLIVKISDDNIINVTGSVGSGKSTFGLKFRDDNDYIVIGLDSIGSDASENTMNDYVMELRKVLKSKFKDLSLFETIYYKDIVDFILSQDKKGIIEGGHLCKVESIDDLTGTLIIKRTARFKCYYRSAYRDFKNPYFRKGLSKFGIIKRFFHCFKRRFHHIFPQSQIEKFIIMAKAYQKKTN